MFEAVSIKDYKKSGNIYQRVATADRTIIDTLINGGRKVEKKVDEKVDLALDSLFDTLSLNPVTYKDSQGSYKK